MNFEQRWEMSAEEMYGPEGLPWYAKGEIGKGEIWQPETYKEAKEREELTK